MFRKLASLLVLAALVVPALAHAGENYNEGRTVASAKHKKGKAKKSKAAKHAKAKKKAAKAKHAKAKKTHAPKHQDMDPGMGGVSHTPPADQSAKEDLPPPATGETAPSPQQ